MSNHLLTFSTPGEVAVCSSGKSTDFGFKQN